jgi:flavin-dependent dehydrogenase
LILRKGVVGGVKVKQRDTNEKLLPAKIVIDAEGISSKILRQTGLTGLRKEKLVYAVEAEVEHVRDMQLDTVEVFLGRAYAPGFYAWLIPRLNGTAKVGLATKTGNPRKLLQKLMTKNPVASRKLARSKILRIAFHPITLGGPISKPHDSGFLAVGDVASQVKPTTGGGVVLGLTCARIAAVVAHEAIQRNNVSSKFLALYKKRCTDTIGFDTSVMLKARQFLDHLTDEKLDELLRFFKRIGLENKLESVNEIDFQGQLLLKILPKPSVLVALAYLLKSYFSGNT